MFTRSTAIVTVALLLSPLVTVAADVPVEADFASFTLPDGWSIVEYRKEKTVRKPVIYLRQKYKTASFSGNLSAMNVFAQDLPAFRGVEMPLSEIDAAFERASNVDAEHTMSDQIIPSMMDLKTATGTLMGHASREYSFSLESGFGKRKYVRMSYASFDGKLYALEMVTLFDQNADLDAWITFVETMKPLKSGTAASSSSSSLKASSASSRSVRGTKNSSSVTTSSSRSSTSSSSKATIDRSPRGERAKVRLQRRIRRMNAFAPATAA